MTRAPDPAHDIPCAPARFIMGGKFGWMTHRLPSATWGRGTLDGQPEEFTFSLDQVTFLDLRGGVRPTLATVDGCDVRGLR